MKNYAIALAVLVTALFVGGTAHAQTISGSIRIGDRNGGITVHAGRHGGYDHRYDHRRYDNRRYDNRGYDYRRYDRRGWDIDIRIGNGRWNNGYRSYGYRSYPYYGPRYTPLPNGGCYGYNRGCGPSNVVTVRVQESFLDQYGRTVYTGRTLIYTAFYDSRYGGYVYTDDYGQLHVIR